MHGERDPNLSELNLSLTPGVAGRLARHPLLVDSAAIRERVINIYYDTPDLRLQRERVVLHYHKRGSAWWCSVSRAAIGARRGAGQREWEAVGEPGDFDFSHVGDGGLRQWLEALRKELQPAFTTSFTRNAWTLEPRAGVRIEVALDRGWIVGEGRRQAICEVGLGLISGSAGDLFSTASELQTDLSLHPEVSSKLQRGYQALTDDALQAVKALPLQTNAGMTAIDAFRTIALACQKHLQDNEHGVCESDDPEFVHQARVAIRRLRSAIRVWRPLLPEGFVSRFDPLWQSLAGRLGEARNWDVFSTETVPTIAAAFPNGVESHRLSAYAQRRCAISREAARNEFRSVDYSRLLLEFTAAVLALRDDENLRLDAFAPACLDKRARQVSQLAAEALAGDAAARHRLRVAYKRLRYALEFFAPLFPGELLRNYHVSASGLQEMLGRLNDLAVAAQLSEEALPGEAGAAIRHWLESQSERLLPELRGWLHDFEQHPAPWRNQ
ncbi:MAG: CHAD domain-containing protein [Candidatus Accumulibacter sp.]|nr:CHAD domain-containing protein [Accumulibacter sp.]